MATSLPLPDIYDLAAQHDAMVLVDDAHGFGVLGKDGNGTVSHFGLEGKEIIQMGDTEQSGWCPRWVYCGESRAD